MKLPDEIVVAISASIFAVILNIVLPLILKPMATPEEVAPVDGPGSLDVKGQFMHMMVHHAETPITSSLIVGVIVFLSVLLTSKITVFTNIINEVLGLIPIGVEGAVEGAVSA